MATQQQPATFKQTYILYYALFAGQALIGLILFYLMQDTPQDKEVVFPFNFLIPGAVVFGIVGAYFIGQMKQNDIPTNGTIQEKLDYFRNSSIMKYAIAEGGNLISLVLTYAMASSNYMIWFVVGLTYFIMLRPSKEKFMEDYQVGHGEEFE